ncbi:MAG: hypothetical protein ACREP5_08485, partial [Candidatus Binatia bacterium]
NDATVFFVTVGEKFRGYNALSFPVPCRISISATFRRDGMKLIGSAARHLDIPVKIEAIWRLSLAARGLPVGCTLAICTAR